MHDSSSYVEIMYMRARGINFLSFYDCLLDYGTAPTVDYGTAPTVDYGTVPTADYGTAPTVDYGTAPTVWHFFIALPKKKRNNNYMSSINLRTGFIFEFLVFVEF